MYIFIAHLLIDAGEIGTALRLIVMSAGDRMSRAQPAAERWRELPPFISNQIM